MKKAKQTKTALDRIAAQLRKVLRRATRDVIEIDKLLIESRKHLEHGEWQHWLVENFDLSLRTAQNYVAAAEYESKSATVADFSNLSPGVLYWLAAGHYNVEEEAAILAATRKGRVDQDAAYAICEKLAPPDDDDDADDGDDREVDGGGDDDAEEAPPDPEIEAILDGPPPAVPPPAPLPPPPDFALRDFDQAISVLKRLVTKSSAQFASTIHTTGAGRR
jgi:Protein of unknown function (DUF3102)